MSEERTDTPRLDSQTAQLLERLELNEDLTRIVRNSPRIFIPLSRNDLVGIAVGPDENVDEFEVAYEVPGKGRVVEADVVRCRNGVAINYRDPYMRRRDPECMVIADEGPSDKRYFKDRFGYSFTQMRSDLIEWLEKQELILMPFHAGHKNLGYDALLVAPVNAAFFAGGLADLQGLTPLDKLDRTFQPRAIIYLAPPFRHTHCEGKQVVVHNRDKGVHEIFSLNLYPGPSAKKGVYGVLLSIGEEEGWLTLHASTVQVVTPYDNILTLMHEGASGGGKSEMLEYPHREPDGRLLLGENLVTGERRKLTLPRGCELRPVTDDMALCHPEMQKNEGKLVTTDAEEGWFLRINHIDEYGVDPLLERSTIHTPEPLIFLNLYGAPRSTCLIWEHSEDAPGKPCPNPRVIMPRHLVPEIVNEPVEVDFRSFGVRTPPCTKEKPTYGIIGMFHLLPPALAWLWRLVAPRGHASPSITDTVGMTSEGVGSYWPFATGRRVDQANLLLEQVLETPRTRYILVPNQHIGAWKTGFMPQWITREYMARRGLARFRPDQLEKARCPLLGLALQSMVIEGVQIPQWLLQVNLQYEVGNEGYDAGAKILNDFFHKELQPYLKEKDLHPEGRKIIECCMDNGQIEQYTELIEMT
jgi:hypothetical protein